MELLYKDLTGKIVDCSIAVHRLLGPGLLESAYEECLYYELCECGLNTFKQYPMPLISELLISRRSHCRSFKNQLQFCTRKDCFIII